MTDSKAALAGLRNSSSSLPEGAAGLLQCRLGDAQPGGIIFDSREAQANTPTKAAALQAPGSQLERPVRPLLIGAPHRMTPCQAPP